MVVQDLVEAIAANPRNTRFGDISYWTGVVTKILPSVLAQVAQWYDWDFLMKNYSSVTTVSGTAAYELKGGNQDLGDIVSIRYGTGKIVLQKFRTADAFDAIENGSNFGGVRAWYQSDFTVGGFPEITLMDTPDEAATLWVLYRQKAVAIEEFPDDFMWVLIAGIDSHVDPKLRILFVDAVKRMIKRHKVGGKDYHPAQGDPVTVRHNRDMWDLNNLG